MATKPMVFVIDDNDAMRRVLDRTIHSGGWDVELYASGTAFLAAYDPDQPGCLVLDLRMPQMSGLAVQEQLVAQGATIPIIFITAFAEVPTAVQAMKAGAVGFLQKPFSSQELLTCIARAIAHDAQSRQSQEQRGARDTRLARLTPREREVLSLVIAGHTNKSIAAQLNIQPRTIEIHRHQIMRKMEVHSAVDLVRLLLSNGNRGNPIPRVAQAQQPMAPTISLPRLR